MFAGGNEALVIKLVGDVWWIDSLIWFSSWNECVSLFDDNELVAGDKEAFLGQFVGNVSWVDYSIWLFSWNESVCCIDAQFSNNFDGIRDGYNDGCVVFNVEGRSLCRSGIAQFTKLVLVVGKFDVDGGILDSFLVIPVFH